jgi:hypothetical protein
MWKVTGARVDRVMVANRLGNRTFPNPNAICSEGLPGDGLYAVRARALFAGGSDILRAGCFQKILRP